MIDFALTRPYDATFILTHLHIYYKPIFLATISNIIPIKSPGFKPYDLQAT